MLSVDAITPYAKNARTHSTEQIEKLAASIRQFGFINPVLIDEDGVLIAGHGRTLAARAAGLVEIPGIRLTHLSEAQRRALVIADNKLAEESGWDFALLADELGDLRVAEFDMGAIGFSAKELGDLLGVIKDVAPPDDFKEFDDTIKVDHRCPKCGYEWSGGDKA